MKILYLFFLAGLLQGTPYKPKEEFDIKLDYQFKQRPANDKSTVNASQTDLYSRSTSTAILPHLTLNIQIVTASGASRVKITNNLRTNGVFRKVKDGLIIPLVIGFTDDVKDRVTAHEYTLTFLNEEKSELSRIVILIEEDGTFIVNDEKRGRF